MKIQIDKLAGAEKKAHLYLVSSKAITLTYPKPVQVKNTVGTTGVTRKRRKTLRSWWFI